MRTGTRGGDKLTTNPLEAGADVAIRDADARGGTASAAAPPAGPPRARRGPRAGRAGPAAGGGEPAHSSLFRTITK